MGLYLHNLFNCCLTSSLFSCSFVFHCCCFVPPLLCLASWNGSMGPRVWRNRPCPAQVLGRGPWLAQCNIWLEQLSQENAQFYFNLVNTYMSPSYLLFYFLKKNWGLGLDVWICQFLVCALLSQALKRMKICYEQVSSKHIGISSTPTTLFPLVVELTWFNEFGDCYFSPLTHQIVKNIYFEKRQFKELRNFPNHAVYKPISVKYLSLFPI